MAKIRIDNIGIIVHDLQAAIAFFRELGMELEGQATVNGDHVDRLIGLKGAKSEIAMLRTPGESTRLELSSFKTPKAHAPDLKKEPLNIIGKHRLMFSVDDLNETVARLRKHGAELVGEVVNYEDMYLLCYLRGPEGIMIALAQDLKS